MGLFGLIGGLFMGLFALFALFGGLFMGLFCLVWRAVHGIVCLA